MKISVITVCFNAVTTIERTFKSVIIQTEKNFEYLVIDGQSNDGTLELINKWKPIFEKTGIYFRCISEKDNGLYDAMNKGAINAKGKWLIYMNADDELADKNVLCHAAESLNDKIDILYGNSIIIDGNREEKRISLPIETIKKHLPFIPQSAFIKTSVQKKYLFNEKYKIAADYDCFLRMYLQGRNFVKDNYFYSKFYIGGISNQNEWETYKEDINVKHSHHILNKYSPFQLIKYVRKYILVKVMSHYKYYRS